MATLQEVVRERRGQLKALLLASRKLDAAQEMLERECKRLVNRKQSVPEVSDAARLISMATKVNQELGNMVQLLTSLSKSWAAL